MSSVTTGSGSQTRKKEDGYSQVLQQPRTELAGKTPPMLPNIQHYYSRRTDHSRNQSGGCPEHTGTQFW